MTSSGEHRLPSDTIRLDADEIRAAMARAEAEADAADPAPEAAETSLECPSCKSCPDAADCPCCHGVGIVTVEQWRKWRIAHPKTPL